MQRPERVQRSRALERSALGVAVAVLVAGCGEPALPVVAGGERVASPAPERAPAPETAPEVECAPCLEDVLSGGGDAPNCRLVTKNMELIVRLYATSGIATEARACELLSKVTLFVRPENDGWEASPGRQAGGAYDDRQITIVRNMVGLGHESLHAFEDLTGVMDPRDPHRGWDTQAGYATFLTSSARMACSLIESYNADKPWCG